LSNTGSPSPTGRFFIQQVIIPPIESLWARTIYICYIIFTAFNSQGHRIVTVSNNCKFSVGYSTVCYKSHLLLSNLYQFRVFLFTRNNSPGSSKVCLLYT
jgi:hypothetical protein